MKATLMRAWKRLTQLIYRSLRNLSKLDRPNTSRGHPLTSTKKLSYKFVEDLPNSKQDNTVYIVGNTASYWMLAFKCPCRCNATIHLNLIEEVKPNWSFSMKNGESITIFPSIWRTQGCKSHFSIVSGMIHWYNKRIFSFSTSHKSS